MRIPMKPAASEQERANEEADRRGMILKDKKQNEKDRPR